MSDDFWDITAARAVLRRLPRPGERDVLVLSHQRTSSGVSGAIRASSAAALTVQGRQVPIVGARAATISVSAPQPLQPQLGPVPIDGYPLDGAAARQPRPAPLLLNVVGQA